MLAVSWGFRLVVSAQRPSPTPLPLPPCDPVALPLIPPLEVRVHLATLPVALPVVLGGPLGTQLSAPPFSVLPFQPPGGSFFLPLPDLKLLGASPHTVSPVCPLSVSLPQVPGKGWPDSLTGPLPLWWVQEHRAPLGASLALPKSEDWALRNLLPLQGLMCLRADMAQTPRGGLGQP